MAYATVLTAISLYGEDAVIVGTDRDKDGARDTGVFELFLDAATNEIDGYLAGRVPLPLIPVPKNIAIYCVDIAMYRSRPTADVLTEEITKRYDAAVRYLEMVATNKIRLVAPDPTDPNVVGATVNSAVQADTLTERETLEVADFGARRFTRDTLRGL